MDFSARNIPPIVTSANQLPLTGLLMNKGLSSENIATITALVSRNVLNPSKIEDFSKRSLNKIAEKVKELKPSEVSEKQENQPVNESAAIAAPQAIKEAAQEVIKLAEKDGHMWECIGSEKNPGGGKIFIFTLYHEFNPLKKGNNENDIKENVRSKFKEVWPAVEESLEELKERLCDSTSYESFYNPLGISLTIEGDKPLLRLPDAVALQANLKRLKEEDPNYENLENLIIKIGEEGTETDIDFVKAFLNGNDVVLSSGKEFGHDFMYHMMSALWALKRGELKQRRGKLKALVDYPLKIIEYNKDKISKDEQKLMEFFLGYFIDIVSTYSLETLDKMNDQEAFEVFINKRLGDRQNRGYIESILKRPDRRLTCPDTGYFLRLFEQMKSNYEKDRGLG